MKLYEGDAIEVMATLPDNCIDLVLTDPPYGTTQCRWDSVIPLTQMWEQLRRIVRQDSAIVFTACQPFTSALVMSNPDWFAHEWIWAKNKVSGFFNAKKMPMRSHESVVVFAKGRCPYYPQKTKGHKPMNRYKQTSSGSCYGATKRPSGGGATERYPRTVQAFNVVNNDDPARVHPTQKPVDLMAYLIKTYSIEEATVLDFAMGSGTTGVASVQLNRDFIGIDLDASIAKRRLLLA